MVESEQLARTSWRVTELGGEPVPVLVGLPVTFDADGSVSGRVVNSYRGWWTLAGDVLTVGELTMTRMAGPPERMDLEARLVALWSQPCTLRWDGARLRVVSAASSAVLDPAAPAPAA